MWTQANTPSCSLLESPRALHASWNCSGSSFDMEQYAVTMQYSSPGRTPSFMFSFSNFLSCWSVLGASPPRRKEQLTLASLLELDLSLISPIVSPTYLEKFSTVKTSAQATCLP